MKWNGDTVKCEGEDLEMNRTCNMIMWSEYVVERTDMSNSQITWIVLRVGGNFRFVAVLIRTWGKVLHISIPYCVVVLWR